MTEKLALYGGHMAVTSPIARYNPIGENEIDYAKTCIIGHPLSGYLGGRERGGHYVQRLEEKWAAKFGVKHAIAVNSATSGLLAAAEATGLSGASGFITTPFSMSATAAASAACGSRPAFTRISYEDYCLDPLHAEEILKRGAYRTVVVTNLFGNCARLAELREICDRYGAYLVEDNAQSILATENGKYAGTIGHIGVFSLNVHKHIQCGEGGIIVTDDDGLAKRMRGFINHGELMGQAIGLNLRMPEVCAAIAIAQLDRVEELVASRVTQAGKLIAALEPFEMWADPMKPRPEVKHVYYLVPFSYRKGALWPHRDAVIRALAAEGVPLVGGYVEPLYTLPALRNSSFSPQGLCENAHHNSLFYFSNCEWTLTDEQIAEIASAFQKVWDNIRAGNLRG